MSSHYLFSCSYCSWFCLSVFFLITYKKSSLPDFSLPKAGCVFCASCVDFPCSYQSIGHLGQLTARVFIFSWDNYSLGQGRITDTKLIFMPVLPRWGDWQVPNQLKGKLCVCCWEEQNWGFHWVWEGFRSLFAVFTMFLKHLAGEWKHKSME